MSLWSLALAAHEIGCSSVCFERHIVIFHVSIYIYERAMGFSITHFITPFTIPLPYNPKLAKARIDAVVGCSRRTPPAATAVASELPLVWISTSSYTIRGRQETRIFVIKPVMM